MKNEKDKFTDDQELFKTWSGEISKAKNRMKDYHKAGDNIVKIFRNQDKKTPYNILFSNVQTLKPAVYAKDPNPYVKRRFDDKNPVARQASIILERVLSYQMESYNFGRTIGYAIQDSLLPGMGQLRIKYEPIFGMEQPKIVVDPIVTLSPDGQQIITLPEGAQTDEKGIPFILGEPEKVKVYEKTYCKYVYWKDYFFSDAKIPEDVTWIAFREYYTRDMLKKSFPDYADKVDLVEYKASDDYSEGNSGKDNNEITERAEVYEIWDKTTGKQIFICDGYNKAPLAVNDDPLNLEGFFPCPLPYVPILTTGNLMPVAEYTIYQSLAEELNEVSKRIKKLVSIVKASFIYDSAINDIKRLMQELSDGEGAPVVMNRIQGNNKLSDAIMWMPYKEIAEVILSLSQRRQQILSTIYEVTGISDIVRGESNPDETATAQRIKGTFASLRITDRQKGLQEFVRSTLQIKAEIISEHFDKKTLQMISGMEVPDEVMELLRANEPRMFAIRIETDSTIQADTEMQQKQAVGLLQSLAEFSKVAPGMIQVFGFEFVKELLLSTFRRFKIGSNVEQILEDAMQQPQPQGPSPIAIEQQKQQQKLQGDMALQQQEQQFEGAQNNEDRALDLLKTLVSNQQPEQQTYANS